MVAINNKETFARYQKEFPHYQEFIGLIQGVYKLREKNEKALKKDIFSINPETATQKLKEGKPLLNLQNDHFADQLPKSYFLDLLSITEKNHPEMVRELRDLIAAKEDAYTELVRELFSQNEKDVAAEAENEPATPATPKNPDEFFDLVPFFLYESLKPFFSRLAQEQHEVIKNSHWDKGICPVCSRPADLSLLRDDEGKRSLFCLQCDFEWPYKRLQCPFCENEDQDKLAYFTIDNKDQEKYRVSVCHQCQRFIKTIDLRKIGSKINLEIENLITLHLDLQADKEGFK
ncbi:MAG: formate dehydrogenase accessory protein FdhE [Pseudomonadota bacterium]|nr:formate dehydrogenase accessory protein FdhE [Pseudomonadota bacterium]